MSHISKNIDTLSSLEEKLRIKKLIMIDKAFKSDDPSDILKARSAADKVIQEREQSDRKSFLVDPNDFVTSLGYKNKRYGLSFEVLRRMALTPVINAIIKTRINQITSFCEPQKDKYSTGFIITKKGEGVDQKLSNKEKKRANEITDIVLSCGANNSWANDDFDTFTRKVMRDSLTFDQMCWEVVETKRGDFFEMVAVDASTFRLAETYDDDQYQRRQSQAKKVKGYLPSYVQIYSDAVVNEYYPWELCFGVRNPDNNVNNFGYGVSELEELIQVITAILWSDEYNRRFFSQGSAPKGILRVDSSVGPAKLQEFKQQWQAMVSGVYNSWKTPILEAGKMDFVNLQTNNRDMEYGKWIEYLIKLACSIYSINPEEINFSANAGGGGTVFESSNEQKLKHSKDKGLHPLMKFYQARLNKFVIDRIDPEYQIKFVGYDSMTREQELEMVIKKATNLITLDEARQEIGYKPLKVVGVSDNVMSSTYSQFMMMKQQNEQPEGGDELGGPTGEGSEEDNPFANEPENDEENPFN